MTTIVTGQFVTISSVQVGGNMSVGADARISGNTTINGNLLVGGGLVYNGATMCANGVTLSGDINVIGINGIDVTADAGTNTLTISGGGGGGSGFPNPANGDLNMNNFGILNVSGITVGLAGTDGYLTITDGTPVTTFNVSGNTGAISNANNSSNTIGSITLNNGTLTVGLPGNAGTLNIVDGASPTPSFNVAGNTGAISNLATSLNSIGGVALNNGQVTLSNIYTPYTAGTGNLDGYGSLRFGPILINYGQTAASTGGGFATATFVTAYSNTNYTIVGTIKAANGSAVSAFVRDDANITSNSCQFITIFKDGTGIDGYAVEYITIGSGL